MFYVEADYMKIPIKVKAEVSYIQYKVFVDVSIWAFDSVLVTILTKFRVNKLEVTTKPTSRIRTLKFSLEEFKT